MENTEMKLMNELFDRLFPICRSIMGEGYRQSLTILNEYMPMDRLCFSTGEKVLNWMIPEEWVIKEAWIKDESGKKIIDMKDNNLHVISYSAPVDKVVTLEELKEHLYTIPHQPEAIPYVTSYYKRRWGFCLKHTQYEKLTEQKYHVHIDSEFVNGELQVGHTVLKGKSDKEVVLTAYLCHPSMANNELSGPILLTMLYNRIAKWKERNLTYRFVINPETIGSIAYLSKYGQYFKEKMYSGMVLNCMGGQGTLNYKSSRRENSPLDQLIAYLDDVGEINCLITPFFPTTGSDERQYCSPGFNLPYGQMSKMMYYPEYHNSLDTKEIMGIEKLYESLNDVEKLLSILDQDGYYVNLHPYGEIKLDQYDLYPTMNTYDMGAKSAEGIMDSRELLNAVLLILNYSDGMKSLSEIAKDKGCNINTLVAATKTLCKKQLLDGPYYERSNRIGS